MPSIDTEEAYRYCEEITRRHAKSFYFAARFLPREKQKAVYAIYAFCRRVDDEVDEAAPGNEASAAEAVSVWKDRLESAYGGEGGAQGNDPPDSDTGIVFAAWRDMLRNYPIPREIPLELIRGVLMDTHTNRYNSFDDLYVYCYRVASTVGLMSSEILGYADPEALRYAEAMGIGMQLTNILRDIKEDAERGRIYIPLEDLERFGVSEQQVLERTFSDEIRDLIAFQIARAREYYAEGEKGIPLLSKDARFTVLFAARIYSRILNEIERMGHNVFLGRAFTTKSQKLMAMPGVWLEARRM